MIDVFVTLSQNLLTLHHLSYMMITALRSASSSASARRLSGVPACLAAVAIRLRHGPPRCGDMLVGLLAVIYRHLLPASSWAFRSSASAERRCSTASPRPEARSSLPCPFRCVFLGVTPVGSLFGALLPDHHRHRGVRSSWKIPQPEHNFMPFSKPVHGGRVSGSSLTPGVAAVLILLAFRGDRHRSGKWRRTHMTIRFTLYPDEPRDHHHRPRHLRAAGGARPAARPGSISSTEPARQRR